MGSIYIYASCDQIESVRYSETALKNNKEIRTVIYDLINYLFMSKNK